MAQITLTQDEMCKAVEYYLNNHMFRMAHSVKSVSTQDESGKGFKSNSVDHFIVTVEQKEVSTPPPKASPIEATNRAKGPTMPVKGTLESSLKR